MAKVGRPTLRSPQIADRICERLAGGTPLTRICRDPAMPGITCVLKWLADDAEFAAQYTRARECCIELMAHEISEIADTPKAGVIERTDKDGNKLIETRDMIEHRRLQVDARKWLLSKMAPKKYGDRQQVDQRFVDAAGADRPLTLADIDRMRAEPECRQLEHQELEHQKLIEGKVEE